MKRLLRRNYSCAIAPHSKNNIIDEKVIFFKFIIKTYFTHLLKIF